VEDQVVLREGLAQVTLEGQPRLGSLVQRGISEREARTTRRPSTLQGALGTFAQGLGTAPVARRQRHSGAGGELDAQAAVIERARHPRQQLLHHRNRGGAIGQVGQYDGETVVAHQRQRVGSA